jgi:hypothetical protein
MLKNRLCLNNIQAFATLRKANLTKNAFVYTRLEQYLSVQFSKQLCYANHSVSLSKHIKHDTTIDIDESTFVVDESVIKMLSILKQDKKLAEIKKNIFESIHDQIFGKNSAGITKKQIDDKANNFNHLTAFDNVIYLAYEDPSCYEEIQKANLFCTILKDVKDKCLSYQEFYTKNNNTKRSGYFPKYE